MQFPELAISPSFLCSYLEYFFADFQIPRCAIDRRPITYVLVWKKTKPVMFFLKEETKIISLHPSYFGPNVREYLINRLNEEEEGRCTGDHFVICVMDMVDTGEGRVVPSSGSAEYTIRYRAIIWKPFRGETVWLNGCLCTTLSLSVLIAMSQVDAIVTSVKPTGIFTLSGPLVVFIARKVCWMVRGT